MPRDVEMIAGLQWEGVMKFVPLDVQGEPFLVACDPNANLTLIFQQAVREGIVQQNPANGSWTSSGAPTLVEAAMAPAVLIAQDDAVRIAAFKSWCIGSVRHLIQRHRTDFETALKNIEMVWRSMEAGIHNGNARQVVAGLAAVSDEVARFRWVLETMEQPLTAIDEASAEMLGEALMALYQLPDMLSSTEIPPDAELTVTFGQPDAFPDVEGDLGDRFWGMAARD